MSSKAEKQLMDFNVIWKEQDDIYRGIAKALGLSDSVFWILYCLRNYGENVTQSFMCGMMLEPKQTINTALKKMESDRLIAFSGSDDGRSKYITLTEKGKSLAETTVDKAISAERAAMEMMTEDEQRQFLGLFRKYNNCLKEKIGEIKNES